MDRPPPKHPMNCVRPSPESVNMSAVALCHNMSNYYDLCTRDCFPMDDITSLSKMPTFEKPIYGVVLPIVVLVVFIVNAVIVLVLSRRNMLHSSTNVVLIHMAVADLLVGMTSVPFTLFFFTFNNVNHMDDIQPYWCYMHKYMMDVLPTMCHFVAMSLTVLLAAQRYVAITYPMESRAWLKPDRVKCVTFAMVLLALFGLGLPKLLGSNVGFARTWAAVFPTNATHPLIIEPFATCLHEQSFIMTAIGRNLYYSVYYWIRAGFFVTLPCILLILLNIGLLKGIRQAEKRRVRLLQEHRDREARRQTESNTTSIMLVLIVTIFIIVNLPQAIFMMLMNCDVTFNLELDFIFKTRVALYFLAVDNMLILISYPINFTIYCSMSSAFRETFKRLFFPGRLNPLVSIRNLSIRRSQYITQQSTLAEINANHHHHVSGVHEMLRSARNSMVTQSNGGTKTVMSVGNRCKVVCKEAALVFISSATGSARGSPSKENRSSSQLSITAPLPSAASLCTYDEDLLSDYRDILINGEHSGSNEAFGDLQSVPRSPRLSACSDTTNQSQQRARMKRLSGDSVATTNTDQYLSVSYQGSFVSRPNGRVSRHQSCKIVCQPKQSSTTSPLAHANAEADITDIIEKIPKSPSKRLYRTKSAGANHRKLISAHVNNQSALPLLLPDDSEYRDSFMSPNFTIGGSNANKISPMMEKKVSFTTIGSNHVFRPNNVSSVNNVDQPWTMRSTPINGAADTDECTLVDEAKGGTDDWLNRMHMNGSSFDTANGDVAL